MPLHANKWMNTMIHKMKRQDALVLILELIIGGILLAKLFPILTNHHRAYYVVLILAAEIYFYMRLVQHKK